MDMPHMDNNDEPLCGCCEHWAPFDDGSDTGRCTHTRSPKYGRVTEPVDTCDEHNF